MNATERAIAHVIAGWDRHTVVPLSEFLARQSRKWMNTYTKPINTPPSAA